MTLGLARFCKICVNLRGHCRVGADERCQDLMCPNIDNFLLYLQNKIVDADFPSITGTTPWEQPPPPKTLPLPFLRTFITASLPRIAITVISILAGLWTPRRLRGGSGCPAGWVAASLVG